MRLKNSVKIFLGLVGLLVLIAFVEARHRSQPIGKLYIKIANQADNYFLDSLGIKTLIAQGEEEKLKKATYRELSIKAIEARIRANLFVDKCEIARNLKGDLFVDVSLSRPVARFIRQGKPDFYIDSLGKIMPTSDKFTARTLLVTREKTQALPNFAKEDRALLELIKMIYQDDFFKAQIAHIHLNQRNEIVMYPQIGNQTIEFGKCRDITEKLKKIKIFYHEILPIKGWKAYKKINVKYSKQIVCE